MSEPSLCDIREYEVKLIGGKEIIIFNSHNMALPIWGLYSSKIGESLHLVTFDTHTDTIPAFRSFMCKKGLIDEYNNAVLEMPQVQKYLSDYRYSRVDFSLGDVYCIAADMPHTEQIRTGVVFDYLSSYTCVHHGESRKNYETSDRFIGLDATYLGDACINDIQIRTPLALDFDLDYFISPSLFDDNFFLVIKPLVEKAEVITIAREPAYFNKEKANEADEYTWQDALNLLLAMIEQILNK